MGGGAQETKRLAAAAALGRTAIPLPGVLVTPHGVGPSCTSNIYPVRYPKMSRYFFLIIMPVHCNTVFIFSTNKHALLGKEIAVNVVRSFRTVSLQLVDMFTRGRVRTSTTEHGGIEE